MRRREGGAGCGTRERGKRKPRSRAALGKPPRGTKTAGSVRLAVNAKAVMPRGAPGRRGRTRHVRQGPGVPGPPEQSGRSGEIQAMRLLGAPLPSWGGRRKRRADPKPDQARGRDRLAVWQVNGPQGGLAKRNPPIAVKRRNKLRYRAWPSPISLRSMRATLPSPRDGRRYFAEVQSTYNSESSFVTAGLVPAIHVLLTWARKTWMPATSAGMMRRDSSKLTLSS